jgi:hypothetical protein
MLGHVASACRAGPPLKTVPGRELAAQHLVEPGKLRGRPTSEDSSMPPTKPLIRPVFTAFAGLITAAMIAGCASERLDRSAPTGVSLAGEWRFNPNLSDDADKLGEKDEAPAKSPGSHRGHGGGGGGGRGGGGMPPMGSGPGGYNFTSSSSVPYDFGPGGGASDDYKFQRVALLQPAALVQPAALAAPGIEQSTQLPPVTAPPANPAKSRGAAISRFLKVPLTMSITQKDSTVTIRSVMSDGVTTADEFPSGTQTNIPYGKDQTADRTVGWRGPVFVVTVEVKKGGGSREDDFAIDDDGRLIMTTFTKGGRLGKIEIKRVYDRVRGAG